MITILDWVERNINWIAAVELALLAGFVVWQIVKSRRDSAALKKRLASYLASTGDDDPDKTNP